MAAEAEAGTDPASAEWEAPTRVLRALTWLGQEFLSDWEAQDLRAALFQLLLLWLLVSLLGIQVAWRVYGNTVTSLYYRQAQETREGESFDSLLSHLTCLHGCLLQAKLPFIGLFPWLQVFAQGHSYLPLHCPKELMVKPWPEALCQVLEDRMEKLQMALHTFLCGRAQATQIQKHIESNNRGDQARLLPHREHRRWGCLLPAHSEALLIQCKGKMQSKLSFLPCYGLVAGHHWCCEDCSYPSSCQALNLRIALLRFGKLQFPTPSPQLHYFHCSSTCHKPICRLTSGLSFLSIKLLTQTSFLSVVVLEVLWP